MARSLGLLLFAVVVAGCTLHVTKKSEDVVPQVMGQPDIPSYDLSLEQTALAARRAMASLNWSVDSQGSSSVVGHVASTLNSNGETVEARFVSGPGEKTTVHVTSRSDFQAYDGGRNAQNIRQFYAALEATVTAGNTGTSPGLAVLERTNWRNIIVTTGNISRSYVTLGPVSADTKDILLSGADLHDALFRSRLSVAIAGSSPKLSHQKMDERLQAAAINKYGIKANAVINVTYQTSHNGNVTASGLAVQFTEEKKEEAKAAPPPERHLEDRLKELQSLREKNLITSEEYYEKRAELLKGL